MVGGKEQKAERKGKKGKMGKKKNQASGVSVPHRHISHLSLDFPHLLNGADKDVLS